MDETGGAVKVAMEQQISRRWGFSTLLVALIALAGSNGCRTTEQDVQRWANTQQGPRKLVAVLEHDKYSDALRVGAAMTLVSMRPRKGQRIGIEKLVETLAALPAEERHRIVGGVVPGITQQLATPPPAKPNDDGDSSIAYKDAAFELLTYKETELINDPAQQSALRGALKGWAMADFSGRMDAPSQKVGMDQMMRQLGPDGVRDLPSLIKPEAPKIARIVSLVAEVGDQSTKEQASAQLVKVGKEVSSKAWLERKAPALRKANEQSGLKVDDKRFQAQLGKFQEEELMRNFASMKRIGGKPVIEFLLGFAADSTRPEKQRAGALAALEGNLDKKDQTQIDRIISLAKDDKTPDITRDLALRRLSELPRPAVVQHLYGLFNNRNWKVRWAAAEQILKMSNASHISEFMKRLGRIDHMALTEPLRYGKLLGDLKGKPKPVTVLDGYLKRSAKKPLRFTALGYYYEYGSKQDLAKINRYADDTEKIPSCADDAKDCDWTCANKELETLGDFVTHCVLPAVNNRKTPPNGASAGTQPAKASQDSTK